MVSVEQAEKVGCGIGKDACPMRQSDSKMPADIRLKKNLVIVADRDNVLFPRCAIFIVRWRGRGRRLAPNEVTSEARQYFGAAPIYGGSVDVPARGPWKRVCRVRFLRYRRYGLSIDPNDPENQIADPNGHADLEHELDFSKYDVWLYSCRGSFKLALPGNCQYGAAGFEKP